MVALILTIAFLPLALLAARGIFPTLRPTEYRPFLFFVFGFCFFIVGALANYALQPFLQSGVIHFTSRYLGEIYTNSSRNPFSYWVAICTLYGSFVLISGTGLAGIALCFRVTPLKAEQQLQEQIANSYRRIVFLEKHLHWLSRLFFITSLFFSCTLTLMVLYGLLQGEIKESNRYSGTLVSLALQPREFWSSVIYHSLLATVFWLITIVFSRVRK